MNPETRLTWQPLKRELDLLHLNYVRLETRSHNPGVPDLNVHFPKSGDIWIELKYHVGPNKYGLVNLGLRPEQYVWMMKAKQAGRRVCLVARVTDSWYLWWGLDAWEQAKHATEWDELRTKACWFLRSQDLVAFLQEPMSLLRHTVSGGNF